MMSNNTTKATTGCACVSRDPFECARVRYRRFDDFSSDERDPCECVCHDDWNDEEVLCMSEKPTAKTKGAAPFTLDDIGEIRRSSMTTLDADRSQRRLILRQ